MKYNLELIKNKRKIISFSTFLILLSLLGILYSTFNTSYKKPINLGMDFVGGKDVGKVAGKEESEEEKGKGRSNFYSIVIGRLKSKDIELGEFTIEVDYATLNRYTNKWIKDEIIGKPVTVSGVSGQFRDNLLLIRKFTTYRNSSCYVHIIIVN